MGKQTSPDRPMIRGKYFFIGPQKIYVRGVCFGPLSSTAGEELGNPQVVAADFRRMKALNINCVRTYVVPERWFLDLAFDFGLLVLVGIPWSQHVAFLHDSSLLKDIERTIAGSVSRLRGHPSVLGYAIGSEIPASIVRWHGPRKVEDFLHRLYLTAKMSDPDGLVTYVNYPTTEYLYTPFDFVSFNVYLENRKRLERYIYRLQNISGDLPLVITELGLDSLRNGEAAQAELLGGQIHDLFAAGCAGGFVFSWTDEWHRGGERVDDWNFGITARDRRSKQAAAAVNSAFAAVPLGGNQTWPSVSVIICVHNGQETMRQCLQAVSELDYPHYEVLVIDDGSEDGTADIVAEYASQPGFRSFRTENRGLGMARNLGLEQAEGDIVAFIDSDAYPDRDWLRYIAADFVRSGYSALGGPNIPKPNGNLVSPCVAASPGWPTHVLTSDRDAEHITGCNMAFRKDILKKIGGFDPQFRAAGDDVDICWRILAEGYGIGFSHGAVVWHFPRRTIRGYWRQQKGYGAAEAVLERKWPAKYQSPGHISWAGRIYNGFPERSGKWRIYHGLLGMSPFQSVYYRQTAGTAAPGLARLQAWLTSKDWNPGAGLLIFLTLLAPLWRPLAVCAPLLALCIGAQLWHALSATRLVNRRTRPRTFGSKCAFTLITALLHLIQPLARSFGRFRQALCRSFAVHASFSLPYPRTATIWNEKWQQPEALLLKLEYHLIDGDAVVLRGSGFDRWDLQIQTGVAGAARIRMAYEEHKEGKQLIRIRCWPYWRGSLVFLICCVGFLALMAAMDQSYTASLVLVITAVAATGRALLDSASATGLLLETVGTNRGAGV
jgi:O-antigen biosynthesis protein